MRPRRQMNQINVVPYVDVMLVLLVIFMVTAPLVNPGVVDLPSVGKSAQAPPSPIEVVIRTDATMLLRDRGADKPQERAITMKELLPVLRQTQGVNTERPVIIAADKEVRYEAVLKVMDELQRGNVRRVGLAVKPAGS
ncbi:MAG: protein TolR [Betaproteobacteria bacterium RIFCSPLOWO2_02_FULL_62_17]|nr:MAG: protein TolR [Betaproteobacteria bacterium RIFCSPLOWO2_02_FULL_62_17]